MKTSFGQFDSPAQALTVLYEQLNKHNLHLLAEVYDQKIEFIDPLHRIQSLPVFVQYLSNMYDNVDAIEFVYPRIQVSENDAHLQWQMRFIHHKLAKGKQITVDGCSYVQFKDKVFYHRDYFDVSNMLYEHIPFFGALVRTIKQKIQQNSTQ